MQGQSVENLQENINSLEAEMDVYLEAIAALESQIAELKKERDKILFSEINSFPAVTKYESIVYDTVSYGKKEIFRMPRNSAVLVYSQIRDYCKINYQDQIGYALSSGFKFEDKTVEQAFKRQQQIKLEEAEMQKQAAKAAEQEAIRKKYEEDNKQWQKERQEKWKSLHEKYSDDVARKIFDSEIWIGMSKEMLYESRGYPEDINRTAGSWGFHEQCIYGNTYIYLEDGYVSGWQD